MHEMRTVRSGRKRSFETDGREMYNRNETATVDIIKKTVSGDYDKDDVDRYISELVSDFSRAKSAMQHSVDEAVAEKERAVRENEQLRNEKETLSGDKELYFSELQELCSKVKYFETKLGEMRRLQEELKKAESERDVLSAKLMEAETKNQELQAANEEARRMISALTQEKEAAVQSSNEAAEQYRQQLMENDALAAQLLELRGINDRLSSEQDRRSEFSADDEAKADDEYSDIPHEQAEYDNSQVYDDTDGQYGTQLVTDSGTELMMMLKGLLQDEERDDNGMRMTKSWEEELEETIPGTAPDDAPITRKVRTKSEVSVEYIAGHKNDI